nr:DMT family transporter [Enterovirga sp. DB1703]
MLLAVTVVGWGLNWPVVKVLLQDWPPLFARGLAGVAAAGLLAALAGWRGERILVPGRSVARLAAAGFANVFAWMGFTTVAMQWLSVAEAALLVYTMPLWVCLLDWPIRDVRPSNRHLLALALGFGGIVVLLGGEVGGSTAPGWGLGVTLALLAAILFAAATLLLRPVTEVTPVVATTWQVGLACAPMLLLGIASEHGRIGSLSPGGALAFAYMVLGPMAACYVTWFAALRRLPSATAAIGTLLVPVIGIVSATLLLGEPLGWRESLAMALTLSGVALALRKDQGDR